MSRSAEDHGTTRRLALRMQQPLPVSTLIDRIFFLIATASAVWLSVIVAIQGFRTPWSLLLFIPVWAILAYLALPRLHKMLSDLYVPDYFFGRTRTPDGLLGDPVNMAVDGSFDQLDATMSRAGWHRAEEITQRHRAPFDEQPAPTRTDHPILRSAARRLRHEPGRPN